MREIAELKIEANGVVHTIQVLQDANELCISLMTPGARPDTTKYMLGTYKKQFKVVAASVLTHDIFQSLNSEVEPNTLGDLAKELRELPGLQKD